MSAPVRGSPPVTAPRTAPPPAPIAPPLNARCWRGDMSEQAAVLATTAMTRPIIAYRMMSSFTKSLLSSEFSACKSRFHRGSTPRVLLVDGALREVRRSSPHSMYARARGAAAKRLGQILDDVPAGDPAYGAGEAEGARLPAPPRASFGAARAPILSQLLSWHPSASLRMVWISLRAAAAARREMEEDMSGRSI